MTSRAKYMLELATKIVQNRHNQEVFTEEINNNSSYSLLNLDNQQIDNNMDITQNSFDSSIDFNSDDSVRDPNYNGTEDIDNNMSYNGTEDIDNNMSLLGKQLEENLSNNLEVEEQMNVEKMNSSPKICNSRKTRQAKRNAGQEYINQKCEVPARKLIQLSKCRRNCKDKISFSDQKKVFENYWKLGSYNQRILFIGSLMEIKDTKMQTKYKHPDKPRNRPHNIKYYFEISKERFQICQGCFKNCFGETESFLKNIVKKKLAHPNKDFKDHRGGVRSNKISESVITLVKSHINSFPAYESHYTRRDTSCKYFSSGDLSVTKMHKLFLELYPHITISLVKYIQIFKTMGIKFKKPKVDTCSKCDLMKAKIDVEKQNNNLSVLEGLKNELDDHHNKADFAYECKRNDKLLSSTNSSIKTFTFDLQQCLPTPFLKNSISFYKRQLWTFNLTIHDGFIGSGFCYMWHEALAKRGGNEISSCLLKHLKNLDEKGQINHIVFYSDSCPGQNKNSYVSSMFTTFLHSSINIQTIDHKFLEPGHTHMECDTDHALIERMKKRTGAKIHHPRDWYNFINSIGGRNKLNVIEMTTSDFKNFSSLLKSKFIWRTRSENSSQFIWKNVRWLRYKKGDFGKIFYKTDLKEDSTFDIINIQKRGINSVKIQDVPTILEKPKICIKKKKDLEDLLPFIDQSFHDFYKNLSAEGIPEIHPDLVEDTSEDEG